MEFEWDDTKNKANFEKHGVDFREVKDIFLDKYRMKYEDLRRDYGESRWITIGVVLMVTYTVVYTMRETSLRIISARYASRKERSMYSKNKGKNGHK